MKEPSNLSQDPIAKKLYELSNGLFGKLLRIIKWTAIEAIQRGMENFTLELLEQLERDELI
ncbi:MAG: hypothetical protein ACFFD2_09455 [Promethearchaeota archaeon]